MRDLGSRHERKYDTHDKHKQRLGKWLHLVNKLDIYHFIHFNWHLGVQRTYILCTGSSWPDCHGVFLSGTRKILPLCEEPRGNI